MTALQPETGVQSETNCRKEGSHLAMLCTENKLFLNVYKAKEIVINFWRGHSQHLPLTINGAVVERVSNTEFLGVHISKDPSWTHNPRPMVKPAAPLLPCKLKRV